MSKSKNTAQPQPEAPAEPKESIKMAKSLGLAAMEADQFDKLRTMLAPFGVKFDVTPIRSSKYKSAKEPFAHKVKTLAFTFLVSND